MVLIRNGKTSTMKYSSVLSSRFFRCHCEESFSRRTTRQSRIAVSLWGGGKLAVAAGDEIATLPSHGGALAMTEKGMSLRGAQRRGIPFFAIVIAKARECLWQSRTHCEEVGRLALAARDEIASLLSQ